MKKTKKIISIVIAVALLISTLATFLTFSATADTNIYSWKSSSVGWTKAEVWLSDATWWGEATSVTAKASDGKLTLSTTAADRSVGGNIRSVDTASQIQFQALNIPATTDKAYIDFTNNSTVSVKFRYGTNDGVNLIVVAAGTSATLEIGPITEAGNNQLYIFNNGSVIPAGTDQFVISPIYTKGTETTTVPANNAQVYSEYKQYWYGKTEGWMSGASNLGEIKEFCTFTNGLKINIPASEGMKSQQILANFAMDGTEKATGIKALQAAVDGSGYLYFDVTVNSATDIKGASMSNVAFKYSNLCGLGGDSVMTTLNVGTTRTIKVDVSGVTDITTAATKGYMYYFKNNDWASGLSTLNVTFSPIYVLPDEQEKTTTTTTTTPATTIPTNNAQVYSEYKQYWYGKTEGWMSGASNLGEIKEFCTFTNGLKINIPASEGMKSQQILANFAMDGTEKATGIKALQAAVDGSGYLYFDVTVNSATDGNGASMSNVAFKYFNICGFGGDSTMTTLNVGTTRTIKVDVSGVTDITTAATKGYMYYFKNNDWNTGLSALDVTFSPIYVLPSEQEKTTTTTTVVKPTLPPYDATKMNIVIANVEGKTGDTVNVPVSINNNSGFWASDITITYDPKKVKPVLTQYVDQYEINLSADEGKNIIPNGSIGGMIITNSDGTESFDVMTNSSGVYDVKKDGNLFTVQFKILSDKVGDVASISLSDATIINSNGFDLTNITYKSGSIKVNSRELPPYNPTKANVVIADVEGQAGETVNVPISINKNPGIWSGTFTIKYDPKKVKPVVYRLDDQDMVNVSTDDDKNIFPGGALAGVVTQNADGTASFDVITTASGLSDSKKDGNLVTVQFKILSDKVGDVAVISFSDAFFNNVSEETLNDITYKTGSVTVKQRELPPYDATKPNIVIADVEGRTGDIVKVPVSINKNLGIWGGKVTIKYDPTKIKPVLTQIDGQDVVDAFMDEDKNIIPNGVLAGTITTNKDGTASFDVQVTASGMSNIVVDGNLFTLQFKILSDTIGDIAVISFSDAEFINVSSEGLTYNFTYKAGSITVAKIIYGDANDDGKVTVADLLVIKKDMVKIKVNINVRNADVNFDGKCNLTDMLMIKKHIVGIKIAPWD